MRDKLFLIILTAFLILSCPKRRVIEVTFWHAMGGPLGKTLEELIKEFEKEHPNIKIKAVNMGDYGALAQKLMGAIAVSNPPTIAQVYESWSFEFYKRNKIEIIDNYLKGPMGLKEEELLDIFSVLREGNRWDGKHLTFPFNKSVPVLFYNVNKLKEKGIEKIPEDWNAFRALLKKVSDKKIKGLSGGANTWLLGCLIIQQGGKLVDEEKKEVYFANEEGVKALKEIVDLIKVDSVMTYQAGYEPQNEFLSGHSLFLFGTVVSYAFIKDKADFEIGIAPLPTFGPNKKVLVYGTNICIFKERKKEEKDAAWKFIKWFTSPKIQAKWSKQTFYVPINQSVFLSPELSELFAKVKGLKSGMAQMEYGAFEPRISEWFPGRRYLGEALEEAIRLPIAPQDALKKAKEKLENEFRK